LLNPPTKEVPQTYQCRVSAFAGLLKEIWAGLKKTKVDKGSKDCKDNKER